MIIMCFFIHYRCWLKGSTSLPKDWRPRGVPVAHLHEHRAAVNRLVSIPDTNLFASSSSDGCIKIWDASKMEGRNIANRSRYCFSLSKQLYIHIENVLTNLLYYFKFKAPSY